MGSKGGEGGGIGGNTRIDPGMHLSRPDGVSLLSGGQEVVASRGLVVSTLYHSLTTHMCGTYCGKNQ